MSINKEKNDLPDQSEESQQSDYRHIKKLELQLYVLNRILEDENLRKANINGSQKVINLKNKSINKS